ncbi:MAG TPA: aldehyde dehydrogenase family protein, partial [Candidatus Nesterenkonia stercoripullorum]|nr:aldehyde dehydrogenase family protein [Candidatus Nesterenkonia stercoripullorum]
MTSITVTNPATGAALGSVHDTTPAEAAALVESAHMGFQAWRQSSPRHRADVLMKAFTQMADQKERLAGIISQENGKSLNDAAAEVSYAAEFFRWYAEEAVRPAGDYSPAPAGGVRNIVTRHPVGVAVLITPWNFPAAMATRKIGPALAAGCSVLLKPAAETPLTAFAIADILREAGVPEGVVHVAATTDASGVVSAWLADDRVRKLSFTGSTQVGRILLGQCADRVLNTSMELGGNAPFIVT